VIANAGSNSASVLLRPEGFGAPSGFATGGGPGALALGDLDGDGKLDVVVANRAVGTVSVLLNDGSGGFGLTDYPTGAPFSVAPAI
jgi:hypothetical protein